MNSELNDVETQELLDRYESGDQASIDVLLQRHRSRLKKMVQLRLNPRLRSRVDDSDILQDALLNASRRIDDYVSDKRLPFFLWLRLLTDQQIKQCHRFHLDAQKRDAAREWQIFSNTNGSLSEIIAGQIASSTPSAIAMKNELRISVNAAMEQLKPRDREILCMRHFEQMTNQEVSIVLEIDPSNASSRYLRALAKLQLELSKIQGFKFDWQND